MLQLRYESGKNGSMSSENIQTANQSTKSPCIIRAGKPVRGVHWACIHTCVLLWPSVSTYLHSPDWYFILTDFCQSHHLQNSSESQCVNFGTSMPQYALIELSTPRFTIIVLEKFQYYSASAEGSSRLQVLVITC